MERWTCPVCGERTEGTGADGLWPPHGWQVDDALSLMARCPKHRLEERDDETRQMNWEGPVSPA